MRGTILHIMNYGASYRGNFMDSLASLDGKLKETGLKNIYMFTHNAKNPGAERWISKMQQQGEDVYFLSNNLKKDISFIQRVVKEKEVKLLHTHFITMNQYLPIYFATLKSEIQVMMHMHNHSKKTGNKCKNILRRVLYGKCIMVACSESVYAGLERDYPRNIKYAVDNGINFSRLDSYEILKTDEFGLEENQGMCLIFGFDFYRKGVDLAVKALRDLREQGYTFGLLISLSSNFEKVEENIIKILGEMPSWVKVIPARSDVATFYNYVDVFLSPSREEGLPYSVLEAGYSGCSVVMSDISAQKNLKIPYGYWFESENIEDFCKKILQAHQAHGEKLRDWEQVKNTMRNNYPLEQWSEQIKKLYIRHIQ